MTIVPGPRRQSARDRILAARAGTRDSLVAVAVAAALGVAVAAIAIAIGEHGASAARTAAQTVTPAHAGGPDAVAAAYAYPLGCLGSTISSGGHDGDGSRANANGGSRPERTGPCWHYGVYVTAVLHQVRGVWRLMLEATSPRCPAVALPEIVRSALVLCARAAPPAPSG